MFALILIAGITNTWLDQTPPFAIGGVGTPIIVGTFRDMESCKKAASGRETIAQNTDSFNFSWICVQAK